MKYIITENKLDNVVFKYLDLNLRNLEKRRAVYHKGIVFAYPDLPYGVLGYENNGTLYIFIMLIDEISEVFGLDKDDSKSVIERWFSNRYQLKVTDTTELYSVTHLIG